MQRFDIRETQEVAARGRYLRWDTDSGQPIGVRGAGVDLGQVWPGELLEVPEVIDKWVITPAPGETGFVRVGMARIDSARKAPSSRVPVLLMETDVSQVEAGAGPGWVSGSPAGLAALTQTHCLFDLGPEWRQYSVVQMAVRPSPQASGLDQIQVSGNDTGAAAVTNTRMVRDLQASAGTIMYSSVPYSNGAGCFFVRPMGRYLVVTLRNSDAANTHGPGARITLAVFPD